MEGVDYFTDRLNSGKSSKFTALKSDKISALLAVEQEYESETRKRLNDRLIIVFFQH